MRRARCVRGILALVILLVWGHLAAGRVDGQGLGAIVGTVTGPTGPLAGTIVQVLNASGIIVSSVTTTTTGSFMVMQLGAGMYTLHALGSTGAVIATATVALGAGALPARVSLTATAAALAGAAAAAVAGAAAAGAAAAAAAGGEAAAGAVGRGLSTAAIVAGVSAAAGGAGAAALIATKDEASGRR